MANVGTATIELTLTGNLPVVAKAFGIMSAALAAYGHEFTAEQMATIDIAAEELAAAVRRDIPLYVEANGEP